jgi:CheY-like chemotaxis protein
MTRDQAPYIFLADDDEDDCFLFQEALSEISLNTKLATARDGEQLMNQLGQDGLPDVLFLDLNMPRKDGFQCLVEIRQNEKFTQLPVIIFSTSFQPDVVNRLYENGAQYYIRKPSNFEHFKKVIQYALSLLIKASRPENIQQPSKDKFVLQPEDVIT